MLATDLSSEPRFLHQFIATNCMRDLNGIYAFLNPFRDGVPDCCRSCEPLHCPHSAVMATETGDMGAGLPDVAAYEAHAAAFLPKNAWDYYSSGATDMVRARHLRRRPCHYTPPLGTH